MLKNMYRTTAVDLVLMYRWADGNSVCVYMYIYRKYIVITFKNITVTFNTNKPVLHVFQLITHCALMSLTVSL